MKNVLGFFILAIISLFIANSVEAEECDYRVKTNLNKLAYNVRVEYEFKTDINGTEYFDVYIYNIVEEIYVNYQSELEGRLGVGKDASLGDTTNGTFQFRIEVPENPYNYLFTVRSTIEGCTGDLRKFTLAIPIRNKYYDTYYCKRQGMEDFYYCKKWITQDFNLIEQEVLKKIRQKVNDLEPTTAYCPSCVLEKEQKIRYEKWNQIKKHIIVTISIGIVIDLIVIIVMIYKRRKEEL